MKKLGLILSISLLLVPKVFSYTIILDPDLFYSFFEKPMTTIEFNELKDGTSYDIIKYRISPEPIIVSDPQCSILGIGNMRVTEGGSSISVRSDAFSDDWSFRATDLKKPEVFCEAVIWFDQGISAGNSKITVASSTGKSEPFVLYTNKGFIGVVPDNPQETVFTFDNFSSVFSFETEFLRPSTTLNTKDEFVARLDTK